jgi:hypothetical protein
MHKYNTFFVFFKCIFCPFLKKIGLGLAQLMGRPSQGGPAGLGLDSAQPTRLGWEQSNPRIKRAKRKKKKRKSWVAYYSHITWIVTRWSDDHDERLTYYSRWVEEVEVVVPLMVASKTVACGGRRRHRKRLVLLLLLVAGGCCSYGRSDVPSAMEDQMLVLTGWWAVVVVFAAGWERELSVVGGF